MSDGTLEACLKTLVDLKKQENELCKDVDVKIAAVNSRITDAMIELAALKELREATALPLAKKIEAAEAETKAIATLIIAPLDVHTFKCPFGTVAYKSGYDKITYEAKNLDKICETNAIVKSFIYPFRKSSPVEPVVTIKLKFQEEPKQ